MVAENATGLPNLFKLTSLASFEANSAKWNRMDADIIAEHAEGIIATTGCPSGGCRPASPGPGGRGDRIGGKWREIFGADNCFLELMDTGCRSSAGSGRDCSTSGATRHPAAGQRLPLRHREAAHNHEGPAVRADRQDAVGSQPVQVRRRRLLPEVRRRNAVPRWDAEVPEACDSTLLIAERVQSYADVWTPRDRMPIFPVPQDTIRVLAAPRRGQAGLRRRFPPACPRSTPSARPTRSTSSAARDSRPTFSSSPT